MRNIIIITLLCSLAYNSNGQIDEAKFEQKMRMENEHKEYSWAHRNLFLDGKYTMGAELFIVPLETYPYLKYDYSGDPDPDTINYNDDGIVITIGSITLEPRVNLHSTKQSAFYLKSPLSLAFSITTAGRRKTLNNIGNKHSGFFHLNAPILFGYARGLNSSYQNATKSGFAISAGYQLLLTPLMGGKTNLFTEVYDENDLKPIDKPYEQRKSFAMPIVQLDYYKLNRHGRISGYSFSFCPYGNTYFKLGLNFAISKK